MKKKILLIAIMITTIIITICIIILAINKDKRISNNGIKIIDGVPIEENLEMPQESHLVTVPSEFFAVEKCIKKSIDESFEAKNMKVLQNNESNIYNYSVFGHIKNDNNKERR